MTSRNFVTFSILLAAAFGSWYLVNILRTPVVESTPSEQGPTGFYLRMARILGTDNNGDLLYQIEADYAEQQENEDIELKNVRIRYSTHRQVPWTINADTATISENQDRLLLSGHVLAVSEQGFSGQATEIRTAFLEIDPNLYTASTDSRVQIRIGNRSLSATGMLALLQDNRLEFKSNVSGKFQP